MGLGSGGKSSDGGPEAAAPPRTFELKDGCNPGLEAQDGPWVGWKECLSVTGPDGSQCICFSVKSKYVFRLQEDADITAQERNAVG